MALALIRAKAPLRLSFAGGGTDVSPFLEREGGCVLSATIDRYAYATVRPREDRRISVRALDFGAAVEYDPDEVPSYDGNLDLAKAAIKRICPGSPRGLDLFVHSDVPPGSGLGSSSTMVVAIVAALKEYFQLRLTEYEIAELAYQIERIELGIQGGYQDQYAAAFGGFNFIELTRDGVTVNPLRIRRDVINELEANLLLVYAGAPRFSAHIIEDQTARYERGDASNVAGLRRIKDLAVEMKNALVLGKLALFGELLHEEWTAKKCLSPKISTSRLEEIYEAARSSGAVGGKVSGAGGGGFMLFYCTFDSKQQVGERLHRMGCSVTNVSFTLAGVQTWTVRA